MPHNLGWQAHASRFTQTSRSWIVPAGVLRSGAMSRSHDRPSRAIPASLSLSPMVAAYLATLNSLAEAGGWARLFGREAPLELEIGFGWDTFLLEQANARTSTDFVGIEYDRQRVLALARKAAAVGVNNLRLVWGDALYHLPRMFQPASLQRVYIPSLIHGRKSGITNIVCWGRNSCAACFGTSRMAANSWRRPTMRSTAISFTTAWGQWRACTTRRPLDHGWILRRIFPCRSLKPSFGRRAKMCMSSVTQEALISHLPTQRPPLRSDPESPGE